MKKIRISERQANILKDINEDMPKNKLIKITEAQYQKILEMESSSLQTEDELVGVNMPSSKVPSNAVNKNFESGLDKGVKKQIGKLYEEFINELYGINEDGGNTYESLIKLMEVAGLIQNGKIKRDKFNNDKERVKEVISRGLYEMMNGGSHYRVMEVIESKLNEDSGYPAGADENPNAPWNQDDSDPNPENEYLTPSSYPFDLIHFNPENDGFTLFKKDGNLFVHISAEHDGEVLNDFCSDINGIDSDCINNYINYMATEGDLQVGLNPFKDILAVVRPENKDEILKYYGDDKKLVSILNGVDEMTSSASSGSYVGQMSLGNKFKSNVPEELEEVTSTTSVGGSNGSFAYDAPAGDGSDFWTKGNKLNKKMNENSEDRYVAEMDFYIYANSDEDAKIQAKKLAIMIDKEYDNKAKITKLMKQSFGQMGGTAVNENDSAEDRHRYTILMSMYKNASGNDKVELRPSLEAAAKRIGIDLQLKEDAKKDTQFPGGGFVELDDCTKLNNNKVAQDGGCSQGDDGVVSTKGSSDSVVAKKNVYETIAKKTGKTIDEVKAIISKSK